MAKRTEPRMIYVVSEGVYSDYHVVAMFEDKSLAEGYAQIRSRDRGYDDAEVEEWPLLTAMPKKVTTYQHSASVYLDGSVREDRRWTSEEWDHEHDRYWTRRLPRRHRPVVEMCRAPMHQGEGVRLTVRGWTYEAVEKVFGERLAVLKAEPAAILRLPEGSSAA